MPVLSSDVLAILKLHAKCQHFHCLPFAGSLYDQPNWIMELFEEIEVAKKKGQNE